MRRRGLAALFAALLGLQVVPLGAGVAFSQEEPPAEQPPDPPETTAVPGLESELPEPPPGPPVEAIEIRSEVPLQDVEELLELISFEIGEPLTDEDVRRTLRNLQASGEVSDIELFTRATPAGGVEVIVVFRPVVQVEEIRIEGELGLSRGELRSAVPQGEAQPLSEERVLRGVFNLLDLYREQGYFQADVRVDVDVDEERSRAVVTYQAESGPRANVSTIAFGQPVEPFEPAALIEKLKLKPGEPYRQGPAQEGAEELQSWLVEQGYGAARVRRPESEYRPETNTVRLTYPIEIGPKIEVRVVGADEKKLRKRGLLPFLGEAGYDEALVLQAVQRIEEYYQEEGHYKVEVDAEEERLDGVLRQTITVQPGPVYQVQEVRFTGNDDISDDTLRELMATAPRGLLSIGGLVGSGGRLIEDTLEEDLENVRSYYALQGYVNVEVGPPQIDERGRDLFLTIPIEEGRRRRVVNLDFEGVEALDLERVLERIPLEEGGPFHPVLLEQTVDVLREAYAGQGYPRAQVAARTDWNEDRTLVDVTIQALEGEQQIVDRIIVRGNRRTEDEVIRRTIDLERGEAISELRLLEIERSLYRLGIFSEVDVALARTGPGVSERDVIIRIREGRARRLGYGVGYEWQQDTDRGFPRGFVSFTHNNVAGLAYSLRSYLEIGEEARRANVTFHQPYLREHPVELTSTAFYEEESKVVIRPYELERWGARSDAVRVFGDRRVSLGLGYRNLEVTKLADALALNLLELEEGEEDYQVTSLVPSFHWDRRNDPILATRGWDTVLQLEYAFPLADSQAHFAKLFLQQNQYFDLGRWGVFVVSARFGGIEPFVDLPPGNPDLPDLASGDVLISERFVAGGDASHRAYARNELGIRGLTLLPVVTPRDDGGQDVDFDPVGGNGLLIANLEYRFPIAGPVGGFLFYDVGNVWPDWQDIDLGQAKEGIGVGVQYLSPIGPIRAGVGWKLEIERDPDEKPYQFFLTLGAPF